MSFAAAIFGFFFYSNEGSPREPLHVHVEQGGKEAKLWLLPTAAIAYNEGFDARTLRELLKLVDANREQIEKAWRGFFG